MPASLMLRVVGRGQASEPDPRGANLAVCSYLGQVLQPL